MEGEGRRGDGRRREWREGKGGEERRREECCGVQKNS